MVDGNALATSVTTRIAEVLTPERIPAPVQFDGKGISIPLTVEGAIPKVDFA